MTRICAQYKGSRRGQPRQCRTNLRVDQILPDVYRINNARYERWLRVLTESGNSQIAFNLSTSSLRMRLVPLVVWATKWPLLCKLMSTILLYAEPDTEVGFAFRLEASSRERIVLASSQTRRVAASEESASTSDGPTTTLRGMSVVATNTPVDVDREDTCRVLEANDDFVRPMT
jgi:hypothetical protein